LHPEFTLGWTGPGPERGAGRGDPDRHTGSGRFDRTEDRESLSFEPADGTRRGGTSRDVQGGVWETWLWSQGTTEVQVQHGKRVLHARLENEVEDRALAKMPREGSTGLRNDRG